MVHSNHRRVYTSLLLYIIDNRRHNEGHPIQHYLNIAPHQQNPKSLETAGWPLSSWCWFLCALLKLWISQDLAPLAPLVIYKLISSGKIIFSVQSLPKVWPFVHYLTNCECWCTSMSKLENCSEVTTATVHYLHPPAAATQYCAGGCVTRDTPPRNICTWLSVWTKQGNKIHNFV